MLALPRHVLSGALVALSLLTAVVTVPPMAHAEEPRVAAPRACDSGLPAADRERVVRAADMTGVTTLAEVQRRLRVVSDTFDARGDARGTFPLVYEVIVEQTETSVQEGAFQDPAWATRLALRFSQEYFDNLRAHLEGRRPTGYWQEYYRLAADCEHNLARVVAQGIVTHLVDDLPRVLGQVGTTNAHKADYDVYGEALVAAAPRLVALFDRTYGVDISQPLQLWFLGDLFGAEAVNSGLFGLVRTFAWINHQKLQVSRLWGASGIAITWAAGSGAIGALEHLGAV